MHEQITDLASFARQITKEAAEGNSELNWLLCQRFVTHLRSVRNRSAATAHAYSSCLGMWCVHLGSTPILSASKGQMEAFCTRPRTRRGKGTSGAPASQKRDADILRSFYRWAHEEGLADTFRAVALHGPTVHNTNPRPLDDDLWCQVWQSRLSTPDRVMLGLGFFCGLRRSEIASLRVDQMRSGRIVNFIRKGGGEHTLAYADVLAVYGARLPQLVAGPSLGDAITELIAHSEHPNKHLLPLGGSGDRVNKRVTSITKRLGVEHFTPHQLRHSCATNLLRGGDPSHSVREILNHSDITITTRYVKAGGAALKEWLNSS